MYPSKSSDCLKEIGLTRIEALRCRLEGAHWIDVGPHQYRDRASSYPETVFIDSRGTLWTDTRAGLLDRPTGQSNFQNVDGALTENVDITESRDCGAGSA